MAIKALIPANQNTLTVGGLYQWDYGQVLEIECTELGSEVMEVHFACRGMEEAIVRPCTFSNGVGTVNVPDRCLEQTNDIVAWVYKINSTQGHTVKTITLPVVARTRPSKSQDVPTEYINQYGELIEEINEAVNALENGDVTAAKATHAVSADSANTAMSATNATYATQANAAQSASKASALSLSGNAVIIDLPQGLGAMPTQRIERGFYLVELSGNKYDTGILYLDPRFSGGVSCYTTCGRYYINYDELSVLVAVYDLSGTRVSNYDFKLYLHKLGSTGE